MRALLCLPLLAACASTIPACGGAWGDPFCEARRAPERPPVADGVPPLSDERDVGSVETRQLRDALIAEGYPEDVARAIASRETRGF